MTSNNIDYLSQLPEEILELIFYFCSETNDNDEHIFIKYEYYQDHKIYQEYCGDMKDGYPHGNGIMYQGRLFFNQINNDYLENNYQTPWIFLPLLYVYPRFEPKLILLS